MASVVHQNINRTKRLLYFYDHAFNSLIVSHIRLYCVGSSPQRPNFLTDFLSPVFGADVIHGYISPIASQYHCCLRTNAA